MNLAKPPASAGFAISLQGCARWLGKRVLGCARPQVLSFTEFTVSDGPEGAAPQPTKDGTVTCELADAEWAAYNWTPRSSSAANYFSSDNAYDYEGQDDGAACDVANLSSPDACNDLVSEAEVDACLETIALTCIHVPCLDPNSSKQRPAGATLLQQSPHSSAWVASLWAPDAAGSGNWLQQRMLVKINKFYSDDLAAKALAAAARTGQRAYIQTERDAMHELRMAVMLACVSVRRIRGTSGAAAAACCPASSSCPDGSVLGGQSLLPVHMEVRACSKRSKGGPDREVVAVYPYHPAGDAQACLGEPRASQQRVQSWLHDSDLSS